MKIKHLRAVMFNLQAGELQGTPIRVSSTIVCLDITAALAVSTGNDFTQETVKHVIVQVRFLQKVRTQTQDSQNDLCRHLQELEYFRHGD
jgi:hypothetical protein